MGRISRDRRDIYYRRAKEEGFRARSAYKLLQLDDELHFLSPPQRASPHELGESSAEEDEWPTCLEETVGSKDATATSKEVGHAHGDEIYPSGLSVWDYPHRAVDLCAAPGSWTQVLRRRLWQNYELKMEEYNRQQQKRECSSTESDSYTRKSSPSSRAIPPDPPMIVAVDLQELAPVPGVFMLKGDITHATTCEAILNLFKHQPADLVVCDGAPDVTGMRDIDEFIQMQLLLAALGTASQVLRPGGTFVCKVFRGEQAPLMYMQLMTLFADVRCCKPAASRSSSVEAFVVCRGFTPSLKPLPPIDSPRKGAQGTRQGMKADGAAPGGIEALWGEDVIGQLVPFLSCGDIRCMDADRNYTLSKCSYTPMPPTQPPTHPAYELAVLRKKGLLPA